MRPRSLVLTLLAALLAVAACSSGAPDRTSAGPRVTIVGQNFTEADVVSQLYRVAGDSLSATTDALDNQAHGDAAAPVSSADVGATSRRHAPSPART